MKKELDEIKETKEIIKDNQKMADDGKKCAAAKKFKPEECYFFIYPR
jgi:hypothetical protein